MLKTSFRTVPRTSLSVSSKASLHNNVLRASLRTSAKSLKVSRPLSLALRQPVRTALVRYQSGTAYQQPSFIKTRDVEAEKKWAQIPLGPLTAEVTTTSSVHPVSGEVGAADPEPDIDMMAGIRSDFVRTCTHCITETNADTSSSKQLSRPSR